MNIKLVRNSSSDKGVYGVITKDNIPLCVTLELPWKTNKRNVSCIPMGYYNVEKYSSSKYPNVWQIKGVNGRSSILIHIGNFLKDTQGCVLVGTSFGNGCINQSAKAIKKLRKELPDEFILEVYNQLF